MTDKHHHRFVWRFFQNFQHRIGAGRIHIVNAVDNHNPPVIVRRTLGQKLIDCPHVVHADKSRLFQSLHFLVGKLLTLFDCFQNLAAVGIGIVPLNNFQIRMGIVDHQFEHRIVFAYLQTGILLFLASIGRQQKFGKTISQRCLADALNAADEP